MEKQKDYTDRQLAAFGKRLKQIRKERGYTNYEQFAFEHNIGRAQYGRYEKGSDLRLSSLLKLLQALGITPIEFFSEGFDFGEGGEEQKIQSPSEHLKRVKATKPSKKGGAKILDKAKGKSSAKSKKK